MRASPAAGYSGTPLAKKLGLREGSRVAVLGGDAGYAELVAPLPAGAELSQRIDPATDLVHLFVTQKEMLAMELARLRQILKPEAALWVSWPKKASGVATTVTEDTIRELALPLGFVDIKVCAVTDVWSGLKLVVRKALRENPLR